jgi:short-subunit dehydrogenase
MRTVSYISGATGFVGSLVTEHLAGQGKDLLISGRDQDRLEELVQILFKRYPGQNFQAIQCNLAFPDQWNAAIEVLNEFTVNEYINCSGIQGRLGPSSDINHEEMNDVFNVNLFSSIFFTNYFASSLKENDKLSIIHFSGGGSSSPRPLFMSYSLSKTSLLRFIENFALENLTRNIRINAIAPGVMPSKMQTEVVENKTLRKSKDYFTAIKSLSDENYDSSKLLDLCDFLLTEKSDGVTGKIISAEWDNWVEWPNHLDEMKNSDLYTLRRITSRDRGHLWGDL